MTEKPSYFAILPANVRYDNRLKPGEKILYAEISALTEASGVCTATNQYFSQLYGVEPETVSRWINSLKSGGYINTKLIRGESKQIIRREITLLIISSIGYRQKNQEGIDEKVKGNNTSNININRRQVPPSVEDVAAYCRERGNGIDAQAFVDFYQARGWRSGKTKITDWQAAVRTWERRNEKGDQSLPRKNAVGRNDTSW